ncbi:MAG: acyloxyacyl hydrolase [Bacteroidia bacterium]|nr:acyloxyacyl hydrolase [Bacteroidia bacterium]
MKKIIYLFFLFICSGNAQGQGQNDFFIDGRMHYGFVIAHRPKVGHLVTGHTRGVQLNIGKQTGKVIKEQDWHNIYNYPQTGITLLYLDFANPEHLGYAFGALAFADLPLIRNKNFSLSLNIASGIGYLTKKYETETNHKNTVTGSNLNGAVQIFFQTSYRLSQSTDFRMALGLTHFSNGSYTTPNLGINNASLSSGIIFYFDTSRSVAKKKVMPSPDKKISYELIAAGSPKEIYPPHGQKYAAWTLSAEAVKPFTHKYHLGIGIDFLYDLSINARLSHDSIIDNVVSNRIRSGIFLSNEFIFSNLTVLLQMGTYLYYPFKDDGSVYHRIGFRYLLSKHMFVNLTLRTHYARADNNEFGLGYKF